jgi:pimeloyl-ACP methyl ester carboxylesterase/sugar lactone lactonase YvrE
VISIQQAGKMRHPAVRHPFATLLIVVSVTVSSAPLQNEAGLAEVEPAVSTIRTSEPLLSHGRLGGLSVDEAGNVYVANFSATVFRVSPEGDVKVMASGLRGSSGNAIDSAGNLLQASFLDGRILRIAPNGTVTDLVSSGLDGPVGLAVGGDGSVFVCNCRGNSISRVAADGSVIEFSRGGDLDCPNGITVGPDGTLYVANFNNEHIVKVSRSGRAERFATVPSGRNAHIAFAAGAFWVTKIETHQVYRVDMNGNAQPYVGTGAPGFADGRADRATLAHPNGIAAGPSGRSLVVNTLRGPWRGEQETQIVLRRIALAATEVGLERITIPVGDLVFDALAAGPADGELVILLHGFPQTGDAFRAQLAALGSVGYRAMAPDQRGYSPGARPAPTEAYAMRNLVSDVIGMADALGREHFHLVGHDWGGAVAWVTATRYPQRVRTLTVLSTPHFAAFSAQLADPESDQSKRSSYFSDFSAPDAEQRFLADDKALLRKVLEGVPAAHRAKYLERLGTEDALRGALNWYRAAAPRPGQPGQPQQNAEPNRVPSIRVPTLYLWGTEDGAFGRTAAEKTADFVAGPYAFHPLEGIGHWIQEQAPDTVTRLLLDHLEASGGPDGGRSW